MGAHDRIYLIAETNEAFQELVRVHWFARVDASWSRLRDQLWLVKVGRLALLHEVVEQVRMVRVKVPATCPIQLDFARNSVQRG